MTPPTVLITGAQGFLGRHAARLFAGQGWRVVGLGRGHWSAQAWPAWGLAAWHSLDVGLEALSGLEERPEAIVHCAGSGTVASVFADPHGEFCNTVGTTAAVLEFIRRHSPETRLVYPSSASVYGEVRELPIAESAPLRPISPYGRFKVMAEELCQEYGRHFGVASARVRFFSLYGPGLDKQLLHDACRKAAAGEYAFFGTGEELRDWLHVDDAAWLLALAVSRAGPGSPVANGASGQGRSVREVLTLLLRHWGAPTGPIFPGTAKPGDPTHFVADVATAASWGFVPRIGLDEGVGAFVAAYKAGLGQGHGT
jgi:UDP-glucose 4-epimerase